MASGGELIFEMTNSFRYHSVVLFMASLLNPKFLLVSSFDDFLFRKI